MADPDWADHIIVCVTYNGKRERIVSVTCRVDEGKNLGKPYTKTRDDVITDLGNKVTYTTAYKRPNGDWRKGDDVETYKRDDVTYIRTKGNKTTVDNLGKLGDC